METKKRKVQSVQRYTFEIIHYEDGYSEMNRINDGFSLIEMLGILSLVKTNLVDLLSKSTNPVDEVNIKSTNSPIIKKS